MFLPTTRDEVRRFGWDRLDVILVSGDCYIDSPLMGVAVIGNVLINVGYRVGVIAQPDVSTDTDITRLGEPELFWGVTAGSVDSMVANRTASGKKRRTDDYTPGGVNNRRPDRASIVYSNLIKRYFKNTVPIILGGIEASLRRIAHYDFWTDSIRRSILFDAKADFLLYGMAERSVVELAQHLAEKKSPVNIRGLCYIDASVPHGSIEVPSFREVGTSKKAFTRMFHLFYRNNDPLSASPIVQKYDNRYLIQNPPAYYLSTPELDHVYSLDYRYDTHPYYTNQGKVTALDTIQFSIASHRGCYGECNFCSIAVHEGRTVRWRSHESIIKEAQKMTTHPDFKGVIHDIGGPTANMYGFECSIKTRAGCCQDRRCLFPEVCLHLPVDHSTQINLLKELRVIPGIKKVVVASGIRYDMVLYDRKAGERYLRNVVSHHVSGQMKIAPEHSQYRVLKLMGKPDITTLLKFKELFYQFTKQAQKEQYLTYYLIAAHPGCTQNDMRKLYLFAIKHLGILPEQVQLFTPTPSTYATLMYYTERDPFSGKPVFVEKNVTKRAKQREILTSRRKS